MRIAIHILVWVIAILFITDQIIKISGKDKNNSANRTEDSKRGNTAPVDPDTIINKGILDHTLVEIQKAVGNGSELIVTGTVTNQGTDGYLRFCAKHCQNGEGTRIYDDSGNQIICSYIEIGNQSDRSDLNVKLISGVRVPIKIRFDVPTVGGQTQAKKIALLEIWGDNRIKCELRNIKIEKVGSSTPNTTPNPVITPAAAPNPSASPSPTITPVSTAKINN